MAFYTHIDRYGNSLLYRGYDDNGNQIKKRVKYAPTLYVLSDKESPFKTLNGQNVKPHKLPDMKQSRDFIDMYPKDKLYGNTNHIAAFIQEHFPNNIQYTPQLVRVLNFDIETESDKGFIEPKDASVKILTIAARCSQTHELTHVWGVKDYTGDSNIIYKQFASEEGMLKDFIQWWKDVNPDVLTGWNMRFYDIPYLINRIIRVLGDKYAKSLSPWNRHNHREIYVMGREQHTYELPGIAILDYTDLVDKFTYKQFENKKLNTAAHVILDDEKVDYSDFSTLHALYDGDYNKYVEYNAQDVDLIDRFELELGLINLVYTMAYMSGVNYETTLGTTSYWDTMVFRHLAKKRIIIPFATHSEKDSFPGAYVKDVNPSNYNWVMSFDLTSLYPSIMMQNNMSPETIVKHSRVSCDPQSLIHGQIPQFEKGLALAANGSVYRTDIRGFLPEIIEDMFKKRVELKNEMLDVSQKAQDATNEADKKRYETMMSLLDTQQMALKISLNSCYGACANAYFRYFDLDIAEGITLTGQTVIQLAMKAVDKYLNNLLGTSNVEYAFYGDTDSAYVNCEKIIEKFKPKNPLDFLDKFAVKGIEPVFNKTFEQYASDTGAYENRMYMKREVIAKRALWTGKKRYIMSVLDSEGVRYKKPKMKIMGIESVKSSTPEICRRAMEQLFDIVMNQDEKSAQAFIKKFKDEFKKHKPHEIGFPTGVSDVNKYSDPDKIYGKGSPINSRASLLYNYYIREKNLTHKYETIFNGDKIKYIYLKLPNPVKENVIGFPIHLPEELNLEDYIDVDTQFYKSFIKPMESVLGAMGWTPEHQSSLDDFFG